MGRTKRSVNSEEHETVNRAVSAQGLAILRTLAATEPFACDGWRTIPAGECSVRELVRVVKRPGVSLNVTRASLSRTLRRLWRAGLVELSAGWRTMTAAHEQVLQKVAEHEADPAAAYEGYKGFIESIELPDRHGSVEAFMAAQRERTRRSPDLRVEHVQITDAGRARLTASPATELTDDDMPVANLERA